MPTASGSCCCCYDCKLLLLSSDECAALGSRLLRALECTPIDIWKSVSQSNAVGRSVSLQFSANESLLLLRNESSLARALALALLDAMLDCLRRSRSVC